MNFHVPERCRVRTGTFGTAASDGSNGTFFICGPDHHETAPLKIIASDGED